MHPAPAATSTAKPLTAVERVEALFGRTDWTVADYLAAGGREFDERWVDTGKVSPFEPGKRDSYARKFVEFHCPPAKLAAARVGAGK